MVQRVGVDEELSCRQRAAKLKAADTANRRPIRARRRPAELMARPPPEARDEPPSRDAERNIADTRRNRHGPPHQARPRLHRQCSTVTATKPKTSRNAGGRLPRARSARNATHASVDGCAGAALSQRAKAARRGSAYLGHATGREPARARSSRPRLTEATGTAEREAAKVMIDGPPAPGSDAARHGRRRQGLRHAPTSSPICRAMCVTPHVAQNNKARRASAIDARTTRHAGYASKPEESASWSKKPFGWAKTVRRPRPADAARHWPRMGVAFTFAMAAYDLIRLPRIFANATA